MRTNVPIAPTGRADDIIDAAARCFRRWGIPRTRMEDVAAEVGIARPHIYRHFGSKDEIIHAVVLRELRNHHARLTEEFPLEGPAADVILGSLLKGILDSRRQLYTEPLVRSESVGITAKGLLSVPELLAEVGAHWEPILSYASDRGELRPGVDIKAAGRWLTFLQIRYAALPELIPKRADLEQELSAFVIPALIRD